MSVRIEMPPPLRRLCGGDAEVVGRPGTVEQVLHELHTRYHGLRERLCDDRGDLRGSVLVLVNDEDIRFLERQRTPLRSGDRLSFVPAYAGG